MCNHGAFDLYYDVRLSANNNMVQHGDLLAGECSHPVYRVQAGPHGGSFKIFMVSRGADNPNGATFTWDAKSDQCYSASGTYRWPSYQAAC
ncbi:hypothetical protein CTZ27_06945 [Streptomyces griseocarneus]|nr:hypothetical protein CTZ27_06945 [Streptomyces griseocarneus]